MNETTNYPSTTDTAQNAIVHETGQKQVHVNDEIRNKFANNISMQNVDRNREFHDLNLVVNKSRMNAKAVPFEPTVAIRLLPSSKIYGDSLTVYKYLFSTETSANTKVENCLPRIY